MSIWTNADGLRVRMPASKGFVADEGTSINETYKILEVELPFDGLPVVGDSFEDRPHLPAHALIVDAFLVCNTAWTGTSPTLTIGLSDDTGTTIDADGIDAAIAVDTAQNAVGEVVACDGDLVNKTTTIGSKRGWVYAATGGTVTAGKSTLYLVYFVPKV